MRKQRKRRHSVPVHFLVAVVVPFLLASCGLSQEEARKNLAELQIPYSDDEFVKRAEQGDLVAVKFFLAAGMSPNVTVNGGGTALVVASRAGRAEVVKLLLKAGATVNAKEDGRTALRSCAEINEPKWI